MNKRAVAATVVGLTVAGAIAGVKYANRQATLSPRDQREIERYGEDLQEYGEDLERWAPRLRRGSDRFGKGLHRMGKGLHRMGRGLSRSFEDNVSD